MLKNYFTIALRNLIRNKTLSFINIFGLSVGMSFTILIGMWIQYESSFDQFNINKDRIAIVLKHVLFNDQKATHGSVVLPLYDELKNNYPEIKRITRLVSGGTHSLVSGNSRFKKKGMYVDADFLKMFSFPLVKGDIETALNNPNSVILSQSLAKALFGDEDPMGKIIKMDNQYDVQVSAIVQDVPDNSTLAFEFLAPFEFQILNTDYIKDKKNNWGLSFLTIIVEMNEGASIEALSKKIGPLASQKDKGNINQTFFLHPLVKWRLYGEFKDWVNTGGRMEYIRLFSIIGIFVLLIACINFMNLSTARSEKRAREVGIRKAIGSRRSQLIVQFLTESVLTAFIAFLFSVVLIWLLLPYLKDLGFENIHFDLRNTGLFLFVLSVCIVTGMLAGSYPALYLSSFVPVRVLKGIVTQGKDAVSFRKILVIAQFVISISLIVGTVIVFQQIGHAKNRSLGYNPDNLITLDATQDLIKNYNALENDLLNTGYIEAISKSNSPMTGINNSFSDFSWEGKDPSSNIVMDVLMTEWDYEKTAGLTFVAGRPFSKEYRTDSQAVIINEAALNIIGYKDPVGKTIKFDNRPLKIVGVIKNVLMTDPFKPISPAVILFRPEYVNIVNVILVRLKEGADLKKSLAAIGPVVEKYNPSLPFEFSFADEEFAKKFDTENQVGKLAGIFAAVAIIISCMGLFGLSMFMVERRSKEISVRKVLGASVPGLWALLSKEFTWLVFTACLIASPATLWIMNIWLEKYDYRISINWWIFAIAGLCALLITFIIVGVQAVKAALINPARKLRTE